MTKFKKGSLVKNLTNNRIMTVDDQRGETVLCYYTNHKGGYTFEAFSQSDLEKVDTHNRNRIVRTVDAIGRSIYITLNARLNTFDSLEVAEQKLKNKLHDLMDCYQYHPMSVVLQYPKRVMLAIETDVDVLPFLNPEDPDLEKEKRYLIN